MKAGLNPYSNKDYFLSKPRTTVINTYREKVYKKHKFLCYVCKEPLGNEEQVDLHHIIPKSKGGDYSFNNVVPVHKTCRETITYGQKSKS
jgi:RNA-directed DNA polymerase